jgi:peptidoglycan/LPS O-acetylase OafA/YrhL
MNADRAWYTLSALSNHVKTEIFTPPAAQFDAMNGVRALATLSVIAAHVAMFTGNINVQPDGQDELSTFYRVVNGGWSALGLFFVLSGFLIGRILLSNLKKTGSVGFASFFVRRGMRVFPAYYFVLTLAVFWFSGLNLGYANLLLAENDWDAVFSTAWQNYTYVMNYTFAAGDPNIMSWAWSLCVEEHFYLLLPLTLAIIWRFERKPWQPVLLILLTILPLLGRAIQYFHNPDIFQQDGFYFRTHNRIDELMIGVVLAYFYVYHQSALGSLVKRCGPLVWMIGLSLIGWVWLYGGLQKTGAFAIIFQYHLTALGTALVLMNLLYLEGNWLSRLLSHRAFYPWARVSYGMYLLHTYILLMLLEYTNIVSNVTSMSPIEFLTFYAVTAIATFAVSLVMFLCLEQPLMSWGAAYSKRFTDAGKG